MNNAHRRNFIVALLMLLLLGVMGGTVYAAPPTVISTTPLANTTGISRDTSISVVVDLPNVGFDINEATLTNATVRLVRVYDSSVVTATLSAPGGNSILLQPTVLLDANTVYRFEVTAGLQDDSGEGFTPYSMTFTTGTTPTALSTSSIIVTPYQLVFSDGITAGSSPSQQVTIFNNSGADFNVTGLLINGTNASQFGITSGTTPTTIPAGGSMTVGINFTAASAGVKSANLRITSTAPGATIVNMPLSGLGSAGSGSSEPSLQAILNTYGIPVNVGDDNVNTTPISGNGSVYPGNSLGQEVSMQTFRSAGTGPVTLQPLGVFGLNAGPVVRVGWYEADLPMNKTEVFSVNLHSSHTLNPAITGSLSFDPGSAEFGFYNIWTVFANREIYSEDGYNTFPNAIPHQVRVYPLRDPGGTLVPNAYIIAFEEYYTGFDYNDMVFIARNVQPAIPLTPGAGGNIRLENMDWTTLHSLSLPGVDFNDWLTFSRIRNVTNHRSHDEVTLRIHNDGAEPLSITSLLISNTTYYTLPNGELVTPPAAIPPGGHYDLKVRFILNDGSPKGTYGATLTINSTDPDTPSKAVTLRGTYMQNPQGANEVTLQNIINALPMAMTIPPIPDGVYTTIGDEVLSPDWAQVDPNKPIYVRHLATFHTCCVGGGLFTTPYATMRHAYVDGQSMLPKKIFSETPSEVLFNAANPFQITVENFSSARGALGQTHAVRFWPARNQFGAIIPNAYFVAQDYVNDTFPGCGSGGANCDYNDNVLLITNVAPFVLQGDLVVTKTDSIDPAQVGTPFDYNISVTNVSIYVADEVVVTDTLPTSVTYVNAVASQGTCSISGRIVTCNLGDLAGNNTTATVTITVIPNSIGQISNTATALFAATDPTIQNNTDTETTTVLSDNTVPPATLTIVKDAFPQGTTNFTFNGSNGIGSFLLIDNGTPPVAVTTRVNFQPADSLIPGGYERDYGQSYGPRPNGYTFGWITQASSGLPTASHVALDISSNGRERNQYPERATDTLIYMQKPVGVTPGVSTPAAWEIALPDGTYTVTVRVGDSEETGETESHRINIEGVTVISGFVPSGLAGEITRHETATATVFVNDGRLTIDAIGGTNTKLNWVEITNVVAAEQQTFILSPGAYTITEDPYAAWSLDNLTCAGGAATTDVPNRSATITLASGDAVTCTFFNSTYTPLVDIQKTPDTQVVPYEGTATFTITVTNTGNAQLTNVTVNDPNSPSCNATSTTQPGLAVMNPNDVVTYTCTVGPLTSSFLNAAIATGTPPTGPNVTDTDTADVTVSPPIPSFITIVKAANPESGQTFNFNSTLGNFTLTDDGSAPQVIDIRVNFQTAGGAVPGGYVRDNGEPYGLRTGANQGGGVYTYGWITEGSSTDPNPANHVPLDLSVNNIGPIPGGGNGRYRVTAQADDRLESFMHMRYGDFPGSNNGNTNPGAWEIAVPSGMYTVVVAVGDPQANAAGTEFHTINVEGVNVINNFAPTGAAGANTRNFTSAPVNVNVSDGRLTINAIGGFNTKISYVTISASLSANSRSFTVIPGTYNFSETLPSADWILGSLTCNTIGATINTGTASATLLIGQNENVTCTYGNTNVVVVNLPPVANDDAYTVAEGGTLNISAPGVLANDTDSNPSNVLTVTVTTGPTNGSLTLNPNGSFIYIHNGSETLTDTFTYTVNDGNGGTDTATVTITVTPVNDPPNGVDDVYTIAEGGTLNVAAPGVLANDSDAEGSPITITGNTNPANGTLTFNPDGSFTYVHNGSEAPTDTFTYTISDGTATDVVTVTINLTPVNDDPVAVDDAYTVAEGGTLNIAAPGVMANDNDPDGNPMTVTLGTTVTNGTLTLNANGSFTYVHNGTETLTDSFTYTVSDGTTTDTATVTINVTPVNDAPVATDDTGSTNEDTPVTLNVLTNDTDIEGNTLSIQSVTQPANGTVTFVGGNVTYTPNANFNGTDTFTYVVSDGNGGFDTGTVTITVAPLPDSPNAVDDTYTVAEGGTLNIAAPGVLTNDVEPDGDPITITANTTPTNGVLTFNADGSFTYVHNGSDTTTDSFTYTISDGTTTDTATVTINVTPVNDPPVAVDDAYSLNEGATLNIAAPGVLANDSDPDTPTGSLVVTVVTGTANGTLTLNANGSFTYVHNGSETTTDSFVYQVSDGTTTVTATATFTITLLNDAPDAVNDTYTVAEGGTLNIAAPGVLTNDMDSDGDPITITANTNPTNGTLTFNADGSFTYVHNGSETTTDSFTYTITDGTVSDTATVTINVTPVNDPPVAVDNAYTLNEGATLTTTAITGVRTNDTDVDTPNTSLVISLVTGPANGALTLNADGSFTYVHNGSETITDSFVYLVSDGTSTDTATVTFTVNPINDPPSAVNDSYTVAEGGTLTIPAPGVLTNDSDAEGSPITITANTNPTNGTLTFNADGSFTYVHNGGETTTDSFTYTISDGTTTRTATVNITVTPVNDPPVAVDNAYTVNEGGVVNRTAANGGNGVRVNDTDPDTPITALVVMLISPPTNGTLTTFTNAGGFRYVHNGSETTTDSFVYQISDGTSTDTATVTFTINPVNDPPVAVNDTATTTEDTAVTINVLANDTDAEGSALTIQSIMAQSPNGTAVISGGQIIFTPNANFAGTATFTYRARDGAANSNIATVTVTVTAVADPPNAVDDAYTVAEGGTLTRTAANGGNGVRINDTDPDTAITSLVVTLISGPTNGTLTINAAGAFTYVHNGGETTTDSFVYQLSDGTQTDTATATITITPVNDAPVAVNDTATTTEDTAVTINVLANDTDAEGSALTIESIVAQSPNGTAVISGGQVIFTPNANFVGTATFTYRARDGAANSNIATVTVTVTAVADPPNAVDNTYTVAEGGTLNIAAPGVLANDSDPDGDPITITANTTTTNGTLTFNADGSFTYVHDGSNTTSDSFTYTISDGTSTDTATVTINVTPVNDVPVANDDTGSTNEDTPVTLNVVANDTDSEGDTLTVQSVIQPANGTVTFVGGNITYTPNANFSGVDTFTYTVSDGNGGTDTATVTITVASIADAPDAVNDAYTVAEGATLNIAAPGVLANDSDGDGDTLTVTANTNPANGTLTLNPDGSFTYIHDGSNTTTDSFTYTITDGATTDTATVNITITAVNDAPVATDDATFTNEDIPVTLDVLTNDTDSEGNTLSIQSVTQPANGTVTFVGGNITYTPNANYNGTDTFTYIVSDGNGGFDTGTVTITVNSVNDAPIAVNDAYGVNEGGTLTIAAPGILANDSDPDGDPLTITLDNNVTNGTLTLNPDGSFTYIHNGTNTTSDTFMYTISDGTRSSTAVVTITITLINVPPDAIDDTGSTNENTPVTLNVVANDTDGDGDTLSVSAVTQPANGTVTFAGGNVTYTPNAGFSGINTFTYTVDDGNGGIDTATVTITVNSVNDAPDAVNDAYTVAEGGTLNVTPAGVLTNDTDADGDAITITANTTPANGTLTLNADGSFTYIHDGSNTTTDSFTYTISDGTLTDTATVNITITAVNDAPVATDDASSTNEDTPVTLNVVTNDTDADGDTLTVQSVVQPANGTVTFAGGDVTYTPNANFNGVDTFTYVVSDGNGGFDSGTVTITVTSVADAPDAVNDAYTVAEGGTLNVTPAGVLANDTDADGDPITITANTTPTNGTLTLNADGSFTYIHDGSNTTTDSFTYTISDGTLTDTATVNITITAVNDAPVAIDDTGSTNEDTPVTINVVTNDTDSEGDTLTVSAVTQPANGTVTFAGGDVTYTPNANFNGVDTFTYVVSDGNGGTATATVTITVTAVADAPDAVNDAYTVAEGGTLNVTPAGVLTNDTDADGDPITITANTTPTNGTLTLNADGSFTYVHDGSNTATDSFTYTISDGTLTDTATVNITITAVNDAPVAIDDTGSTNEDTPVTLNVVTNDTDADGDTLTVSAVTQPANGIVTFAGGDVTYTPNANFNGVDTFTYVVSDGNGGFDSGTVTITVTSVADVPDAVNDAYTVAEGGTLNVTPAGVLANDTDADGDAITITANTNPANGTLTLNADGSFTYVHDGSNTATDSFTYTISDGTLTDTATVNITITTVNDAPVATDDASSTNEDTPVTLNVVTNDTDSEGDTLTVQSVIQPANGIVTFAGGDVTYTPNANFNGADTFTYVVSDGNGGTATATVTITVTAVADAPDAVNDAYTVAEGGTLNVTPAGVLTNDTDADGDPITITANTTPTNGTLTLNADGSFTYVHDGSNTATDSFTYTISDGTLTDTATVNITITAVNDAPVAIDDTGSTNEDTPLTLNVVTNDTDADGDTLTVQSVVQPANGTVTFAGGDVTYTPNANFNGADTFTYTVSDGNGGTATATVTVAVVAVNDAPNAVDDSATTAMDTPVVINVLTNDTDAEGDSFTVTANTTPTNGTVTLAGGAFTYTPNTGFFGANDSFTYTIDDGNGGTDTALVTIGVATPNFLPVGNDDAYNVNEGATLTLVAPGVLGNDTDANGDTLTVIVVTGPANGTLTLNADGSFTYVHNGNETLADTFTYQVDDGNGGTDTAQVNLTITPLNDAPNAVNDTAATTENTPVTLDVVANDTDIEGNTLTLLSVTQPANGTVTFTGNSVTYTPNAGYSGADTFTYTIDDGNGGTAIATVNVNVAFVNDVPDAVNDTATTNEDVPVTINVLVNDTDGDGDTLTISAITQPANGTTVIMGGQISFTPAVNFSGSTSFTYTVADGNGGTDTATVNVMVNGINDTPVANADNASTNQNTPVTITVLTNDTDVDGDTLTVTGTTQPTNGTVTFTGSDVTYTPDAGYSGTDIFTYTIDDGNGGVTTATVTVNVAVVNSAPNANNDTVTVNEDGTTTIDVLANDTDANGDILTIASVTQPANGTTSIVGGQIVFTPNANFNGTTSFTYTVADGNGGTDTATVNVTVNAVNDPPVASNNTGTTAANTPVTLNVVTNDTDVDGDTLTVSAVTQPAGGTVTFAGGNITFTPNAGFSGPATFTYTVADGNGGTATATVTITVTAAPNNTPNANDDTATVNEDNPTTLNVVSNDTDADGDTLTVSAVTQPANGNVTFAGGNVTFTPNANFNGTTSFTYTVADGNGGTDTATVNVTVNAVNDPPVASNNTGTTAANTPVTLNVVTNDTDVDGDTLTVSAVTQPAGGTVTFAGGNITFTPNAGFSGPATFTYTVADGNGGTATATVTITVTAAPNNTPNANDDTATVNEDNPTTLNVVSNDTDADGDTLTVSAVTQPANGNVTFAGGNVTFTPNANFNGTTSFTYTVADGNGGTDTATVNVTVNAVNDAPTASNDAGSTSENTPVTIDVLTNDTDIEGDALTVSVVTQPANGTVTFTGTDVTYTPNTGYSGTDTFTYTVSDGNGGTTTATVTVGVALVNVAPVVTNDTYSLTEGQTLTVNAATGVLSNDTDADGDPMTVTLDTNVTNGTLTLNPDGSFTYVPNAGFTGSDTFTYIVDDGNGGTTTGTVTLFVNAGNPSIDLRLSPANQTINSGDDADFTVRVENTGDVDLSNVTVTASDAICNNTFASLLPGDVQTYTCTVTNVTADFTLSASVTGTTPSSGTVADNDTADVTIAVASNPNTPTPDPNTVVYPPGIVAFDPFITKIADPPFAIPGEAVTFTFHISNPNTVPVNNVQAIDPIPPEVVILSATAPSGHVTISGQDVIFTQAVLAPNETVTVTIQTRVRGNLAVPFVIVNKVCMTGGNIPGQPCATATVTSITALPSTGETPWWRNLLIIVIAGMMTIVVVGIATLIQAQPEE